MKPWQVLEDGLIENIADILANCDDWHTADLALEVDAALADLLPALSAEIRSKVVESFFQLRLEDRMSPNFDHKEFVLNVFMSA